MKTFSRIIVTLPLLWGMAFIPSLGRASETRLNAVGGLRSVLADETSDLNLFLDGNPAGLVYLNSRSRVDLSGQWRDSDQEGPWGSARLQGWYALAPPADPNPGYGGVMLFPSSHWAIQAAGSFSGTGGTGAPAGNQYQGLIRACYALPFATLGVELLDSQQDLKLSSSPFAPASEFLSGESARNQLLIKTGAAVAFPGTASPDEPRWQAGAYLAIPAGPQAVRQALSLFETSPVLVSQTNTTTLYHALGAELLYEVPASLKIEFSAALLDSSSDFEQSTSSSSLSAFLQNLPRTPGSNSHSRSLECSFRYTLPLNGDQNLKCGGSLGFRGEDLFANYGFFSNSFQQQQLNFLLGFGFEEVKEYTMGLQWKSRHTLAADWDSLSANQPDPEVTNFGQLAFGGERWLSPTWALRLGLVVEQDDAFQGDRHTLTTSVHGGAGWEQAFGRMDFDWSLGQTLDTGNSSNTIGLFSAELSATLFL